MSVAHAIGSQLAHPHGWAGRLLGPAMTFANRRPTRLAVAALGARPGQAMLDIGCGTGEAVALLANTGADVTGIDRSTAMLDQAARRNRRAMAAGRVTLRRADFTDLPFAAATFDGILAANVAYFWADPPAMTGELRRLLRPGGRLVVYVTDAETMRRWPFAGPETHRHWTADTLSDALHEGGFASRQIDVRSVALPFDTQGLIAIATR